MDEGKRLFTNEGRFPRRRPTSGVARLCLPLPTPIPLQKKTGHAHMPETALVACPISPLALAVRGRLTGQRGPVFWERRRARVEESESEHSFPNFLKF